MAGWILSRTAICRTCWIWGTYPPDKRKTIMPVGRSNSFPYVLLTHHSDPRAKNPPSLAGFGAANHFCHVRFLWRFALRRFRRLCFDIFRRRFFLRFPMVKVGSRSVNLRFTSSTVKHNLSARVHDHFAGSLRENHLRSDRSDRQSGQHSDDSPV